MTTDATTMKTTMGIGKSVWVQMRMDEHFKARLQDAANRRGLDMTSLIMHAITAQYPEVMGAADDGQGHGPGGSKLVDLLHEATQDAPDNESPRT